MNNDYRLLPVALAPHIKDAIESCGAFNPLTIWQAVIAANDLVCGQAAQSQASAAPRNYVTWWTSIETDVRKSMLVFARREPERLHALVRQAYEAGQQSIIPAAAPVLTDAQILSAARVLANRSADACNVDREDNWKFYSDDFMADARAALEAAATPAKTEW